jgi:hypothetical protein
VPAKPAARVRALSTGISIVCADQHAAARGAEGQQICDGHAEPG